MKTYDPAECLLSFDGVPISGYADDTFLELEANDDSFTLQKGADGEGTRSRSRNRSMRLTVTLMQGSASNDYLSGRLAADLLSGAGAGALQFKELNGTTVVNAAEAWVMRTPTISRAKESGTVQWVFEMDAASAFVGGLVSL